MNDPYVLVRMLQGGITLTVFVLQKQQQKERRKSGEGLVVG